jgi:hypothetical protein
MRITYDRETRQFVGIDERVLANLSLLFPGVNIQRELVKMGMWLDDSPKAKKHRGTLCFINAWLRRIRVTEPVAPAVESNLSRERYVEDLWKGRRSILEMNTHHS